MVLKIRRGNGLATDRAVDHNLAVHVSDDLRWHTDGPHAYTAKVLVSCLTLPAARDAHEHPTFIVRALTRLVDKFAAVRANKVHVYLFLVWRDDSHQVVALIE